MVKPGPLMWLRYTFVGSLPPRYSEWVLHDVTTGAWVARHIARVLVLLAVPETVVILAIPAAGSIKALTAFVTGACVVLLMSILSNDVVERLSHRAGHPWGTAERVRAARSERAQREHAAAYRERVQRRRSA